MVFDLVDLTRGLLTNSPQSLLPTNFTTMGRHRVAIRHYRLMPSYICIIFSEVPNIDKDAVVTKNLGIFGKIQLLWWSVCRSTPGLYSPSECHRQTMTWSKNDHLVDLLWMLLASSKQGTRCTGHYREAGYRPFTLRVALKNYSTTY